MKTSFGRHALGVPHIAPEREIPALAQTVLGLKAINLSPIPAIVATLAGHASLERVWCNMLATHRRL